MQLLKAFQIFCSIDAATESNSVDENIPTAEEATEATEVNAGTGEDTADIAQTGVYTEHVFTDPLGVQNTTEASPVYQPRYIVSILIPLNMYLKRKIECL